MPIKLGLVFEFISEMASPTNFETPFLILILLLFN